MNDVKDRASQAFQALPMVHRIVLVAVAVGLVMGSVAFASWISAPEMTILASGLDDAGLADVVDELEGAGVPYEIGGGGSSVMVSRDDLYTTRAQLATSGIATGDRQEGWEVFDQQGIAISDFQQQANYQRALEGELARTLTEMQGVDAATVHLVFPQDRLFTEQQEPRTASVLLDTGRSLGAVEVEAVVFLVSSAVEGLDAGGVTVADADGTVLHAPGESGGLATGASKQLRETREFEQSLAGDIQRLLDVATGSTASVVVRARLDFDQTETAQRVFDPDAQVATSEQEIAEVYTGSDPGATGVVGVDGGPIDGAEGGTTDYERSEVLREYGVSETTTTTVQAPGKVEGLSVAIVMDDGSLTGARVPGEDEVAELVSAAVGLDDVRGDSIAVTRVAYPEASEEAPLEGAGVAGTAVAMASRIGAVAVFVVVAVALFLMSRRRDDGDDAAELEAAGGPALAGPVQQHALGAGDVAGLPADAAERVLYAEAAPVGDQTVGGARNTPPSAPVPPDDTARREVEALVERQPEEIANLLRGWLADAGS